MTKEEYRVYLQTERWRVFSRYIRDEAGACEECGITDTLNVHHLHYRSLGNEKREDLRVLCERCHINQHILEDRMEMFGVEDSGGNFIEKRDVVQRKIQEKRGDYSDVQATLKMIGDSMQKPKT